MKIERLLAITVMLLVKRRVTANQLAEHFAVSPRTIYRDLETLNAAGIPIHSCPGFKGGFSIPENFTLSRQLLTYDDLVSVLTALKGINSTMNNSELAAVINKFTALIPAEKRELFAEQSDTFFIDISPWGSSSNLEDLLPLIQRGISESRLMRFRYTNGQGHDSDRRIEPHTLAYKSFNWYLLGYCRLRQAFRIFRLSRMKDVLLLHLHFKRRKCVPHSYFEPPEDAGPTAEVVLRFSPRQRLRAEEMFSREQLVYGEDGSTTAIFAAPQDDWLFSLILSFGDDVEIVAPSEWRRRLIEKIEKMKSIYGN